MGVFMAWYEHVIGILFILTGVALFIVSLFVGEMLMQGEIGG